MSLRLRFSDTDLIDMDGSRYRPIVCDENGILLQAIDHASVTERITHEKMEAVLKRHGTRYFPGYFERCRQDIIGRKSVKIVNELPDKVRRQVLWREAFCKAFLRLQIAGELKRTRESYEKCCPSISTETNRLVGEGEWSVSAARPGSTVISRALPRSRTAFEWVRLYETGGYSAVALIPETHRCGNRSRRWCHHGEALLGKVVDLYANTQRPTKIQAVDATIKLFSEENDRRQSSGLDPLKIPCTTTIKRRLALADPYYVHSKRYGVGAANSKFTLHQNGLEAKLPLEIVQMDENQLDVISVFSTAGIWDHLPPERQRVLETRMT